MISGIINITARKPDAVFFTSLLKKELVAVMGCTEPAAAALAGANARRAFGAMPERILIRASRDIIKNAMHAGIPHTDMKGINAAAALGITGGDPAGGLNILSSLAPGTEQKARNLLGSGKMKLELAENVPLVFIEVLFENKNRRVAARIRDSHDHVEIIENPGDAPGPCRTAGTAQKTEFGLPAVYEYTNHIPAEEISFLVDGAQTNLELARHSIKNRYGIQVGKTMIDEEGNNGKNRASPDYLFRLGASLAAAASDARMAGCSMPVMINSGSGNQGITVSVPVLVLAEGLGADREETARALCLAHLTALMITARKDRLSALCGAFTAAIGTAAGFVRLLGGDYGDIERCISNMAGNLIGILCDGAKGSCALKIYSCVEAAAMGAKIAIAGRSIPPSEGILGNNLDETLEMIRKISHDGMIPLDKVVLGLMLGKTGPDHPAGLSEIGL
jgi:L-cysteine desulfidase